MRTQTDLLQRIDEIEDTVIGLLRDAVTYAEREELVQARRSVLEVSGLLGMMYDVMTEMLPDLPPLEDPPALEPESARTEETGDVVRRVG